MLGGVAAELAEGASSTGEAVARGAPRWGGVGWPSLELAAVLALAAQAITARQRNNRVRGLRTYVDSSTSASTLDFENGA